ncbi:MAG: hypothetical protein J2O48_02040 [Solirubrobacterales bacterium]|nr:hypothetical protein [Solirubrobacterales bacterium]
MNLRERAAFAYRDRVQAETEWLAEVALDALSNLICDPEQLPALDADCIEEINAISKPPYVDLTVDHVEFRVKVETKQDQLASGVTVDDWTATVMACRNASWYAIEDLADLGHLFINEPLPERSEEAVPVADLDLDADPEPSHRGA